MKLTFKSIKVLKQKLDSYDEGRPHENQTFQQLCDDLGFPSKMVRNLINEIAEEDGDVT